ncbi:MAG: signal recognition particle-docking protein FtsY [Christensenellales bacterium]|jgi:fused signal recognition particle receptor
MEKKGLFARFKDGLAKTRNAVTKRIGELFQYYTQMNDEFFDDLEAILIGADMGTMTVTEVIDEVRAKVKEKKIGDADQVKELLVQAILKRMDQAPEPEPIGKNTVLLIVGVNGVGKTTSIGKLTHRLKDQGHSVLLAAADTFRAAAVNQLKTWAQRADTTVIAHEQGADPAAVVYDALAAKRARGIDILIVDTAGRLHNKKNLMNELEKIHRVIGREAPDSNLQTLLVLDATTGQNALQQAKTFGEVTHLTGVVLTKLDGTAKGGVVVPIQAELRIPVRYVGIGEALDDLQPFDAETFVRALFD